MASPKIIAFFLLDPVTQAPVVGQILSWVTYKNELGVNLAQPAFVEIGQGAYYFTPTFTTNHGIAYLIDTGAGASPSRLSGYIRPEDFNTDNVDVASSTILADVVISKKVGINKWAIITSGPEANRFIVYDDDGTTILYRFDLKDSTGAPTVANPFSRTPV